jgi:hypothetical protein
MNEYKNALNELSLSLNDTLSLMVELNNIKNEIPLTELDQFTDLIYTLNNLLLKINKHIKLTIDTLGEILNETK